MSFYILMLRISWTERIRNEEVLSTMQYDRNCEEADEIIWTCQEERRTTVSCNVWVRGRKESPRYTVRILLDLYKPEKAIDINGAHLPE